MRQNRDGAYEHSWSGHKGTGRWAGQACRTEGHEGSREEDRAPAGKGAARAMRGGRRKAPARLLGSPVEDHL